MPIVIEKILQFYKLFTTQLFIEGIAERVAEEYSTNLGNLVGYHIGSRGLTKESQKVSNNTRIEFVTEG